MTYGLLGSALAARIGLAFPGKPSASKYYHGQLTQANCLDGTLPFFTDCSSKGISHHDPFGTA
jgi:hypothetical protein